MTRKQILANPLAAWMMPAMLVIGALVSVGRSYSGEIPAGLGYTIELEQVDAGSLQVAVTLPPGTLEVSVASWGGADHLPASWSTYIGELRAVDGAGDEVSVQSAEPGRWRLREATVPITLTYRVDLAYAEPGWPVGQEQAGWRDGTTIYSVTRPLFVSPDSWKDIPVRFDLPEGWSAQAPWPEHEGANAFLVPGVDELRNNAVVLGTPRVAMSSRGGLRVRLILLDQEADPEAVIRVFEAVSARYLEVFPETPADIFQLVVMRLDVNDGEGFRNGATFTLDQPLTEASLVGWADLLAHELLHYWNGRRIRAQDRAAHRWFSEGFTEFVSNRTLVRVGVLPSSYMLAKIEKNAGLYALYLHHREEPLQGLAAAGAHGGLERLAVYNGGWLMAMCSDLIIRQHTDGAGDVDQLLGELYERFGDQDRRFTADDFRAVASEVGGPALAEFLDAHATGSQPVDQLACLRKAGLGVSLAGYSGEAWVYELEDSDNRQLDARSAILGGSAPFGAATPR